MSMVLGQAATSKNEEVSQTKSGGQQSLLSNGIALLEEGPSGLPLEFLNVEVFMSSFAELS